MLFVVGLVVAVPVFVEVDGDDLGVVDVEVVSTLKYNTNNYVANWSPNYYPWVVAYWKIQWNVQYAWENSGKRLWEYENVVSFSISSWSSRSKQVKNMGSDNFGNRKLQYHQILPFLSSISMVEKFIEFNEMLKKAFSQKNQAKTSYGNRLFSILLISFEFLLANFSELLPVSFANIEIQLNISKFHAAIYWDMNTRS